MTDVINDSQQPVSNADTLTGTMIRDAGSLFFGLLHNDMAGIYIVQDDRFRYVNPRFAQLFGYSTKELCGKLGPIELTAPEYRKQVQHEIARRMHGETNSSHYSFTGLRKDGSQICAEAYGSRTEFEGRPAIIGILLDCTERYQADQRAKEQLLFTEQLIETIPNPVFYKDEQGRYLGCNHSFEAYIGRSREEIIGKTVHDISPPDLAEKYASADQELFDHPGVQTYETSVQSTSGERKDVVFHKASFNKPDGSVGGLVGVIHDITERKRTEAEIWQRANYDALTNLPNRRLFLDRLQQEVIKSPRSGKSLALMYIDLDRFKEVNDTLGHKAGDQLLMEAAKRIKSCVRNTDTVARLGGDEFTVILPDITESAHIEHAADDIIDALRHPFQLGRDVAHISASIGVTFYPKDADNFEALLISADQAMYDAKEHGKNRFSYYKPEMQKEALERIALGNDLRRAVEHHQLELHYQPIIDLASGRITKAETLLRWNHPKHGRISPDKFIPLAEDLGLISKIGDWVFQQSATMTKTLLEQGGHLVQIGINKSPRQFLTGSTHETWVEYLKQQNIPAECICLEITEDLLMDDRPEIKMKLQAFHQAGIQLSLDDFGIGYSAMGYLKEFDIDYLKIDTSFARNIAENTNDRAIMEAIIAMAHKLDIKVVAEGVETEQQRLLLTEAGCNYGQGYLFSKPLPADEFRKLLSGTQ